MPTFGQDEMREKVVIPAFEKVEQRIREEYADLYPRPHTGKTNIVDTAWLDDQHEYFDVLDAGEEGPDVGWYQAYRRLNAFGTFDNKFTDQLDLDGFTQADSPEMPTKTPDDTSDGTEDGDDGSAPDVSMDSGFDLLAGAASIGAATYWLTCQADDGGGTEEGVVPKAAGPESAGFGSPTRRVGNGSVFTDVAGRVPRGLPPRRFSMRSS